MGLRPGDLFYRGKSGKSWRKRRRNVITPDGIVHLGRPMHRIQQGAKAIATDYFGLLCDGNIHTNQQTQGNVSCMVCLAHP